MGRKSKINRAHGLASVAEKDRARFNAKVPAEIDEESCWEWQGHRDRKGYGQFHLEGRAHWAHRVAFVIFNGPLKDGREVDHTCENHACVNPKHLKDIEPVGHRSQGGRVRARKAAQTAEIPV